MVPRHKPRRHLYGTDRERCQVIFVKPFFRELIMRKKLVFRRGSKALKGAAEYNVDVGLLSSEVKKCLLCFIICNLYCIQEILSSEKMMPFKAVQIYWYITCIFIQWDSGCQDCHCYIWSIIESHQSSCSPGPDQSEIPGSDRRRVSLHKEHQNGLL